MLGRHQGVSVHIHRGRDLGVPHQLLMHPDRVAGVVQPGTVGVAESVPPHSVGPPGSFPTLFVDRKALAIGCQVRFLTPNANAGSALRALHKTPTGRTDVVLLNRGRVVVAPCDGARKDQVQSHKWGFSLGQGLPDLFFALALPNQKNRREIGIKRGNSSSEYSVLTRFTRP